MGASRERKKRQEYYANGGVDKKAVREAEEKAKQKKDNLKLLIGVGAFVLLAAFLLVYNSGIFHRNNVAVTVGDKEYTAADYSYHFYDIYNGYYQQYGEMAAYLLGDLSATVVDRLEFLTAVTEAAEAEGFTLTAEDETILQEQLDTLKANAERNAMSYKSYISHAFGKLVTPEVLERNLRQLRLANAYTDKFTDTLEYSDEEVAATYEASPKSYDEVNGFLVSVSGSPASKTDADGNVIPATDEEKAAAMATAKETADAILADYKKGGDLKALAEEKGATYSELDGHKLSAAIEYSEWLFEDGRKEGDCAVVESSSSAYVVVFTERYRNETTSVNVRHILLNHDTLDVAEGEADEAALEQMAELLMAGWDGTETGFAGLAMINSQDAGSAENGGLYEDVLPTTNFVPEFLDWCFAEGREPGDTGIIHTDHGCHIMYLSSLGELVAWEEDVRADLYDEDYSAWEAELREGYTAVSNTKVMDSIDN